MALPDRDQRLPDRARAPHASRAAAEPRGRRPAPARRRGDPRRRRPGSSPTPDEQLGLPRGRATPDAVYEQHEAVELAFVAALQHLAVNQRVTLILRDVLGFTAAETASVLKTSVASVTSALQRARVTVRERVPERSQQRSLRALGDRELSELVSRYMAAWERCDVDSFVGMLADEATFAMPPMATWYAGRAAIGAWASAYSLSDAWSWRALPTRANGQAALAFYVHDPATGAPSTCSRSTC